MFKLKLNYYRWRTNLYHYLLNRLNEVFYKPRFVEEYVYDDVLRHFSYNKNTYYKLYQKFAPIGEFDLHNLMLEIDPNNKCINDSDLEFMYESVIKYLNKKLNHSDIRLLQVNDDGVKYLEIHVTDK